MRPRRKERPTLWCFGGWGGGVKHCIGGKKGDAIRAPLSIFTIKCHLLHKQLIVVSNIYHNFTELIVYTAN